MNSINDILATLKPISLQEMDSVKLLNRIDTKFLIHKNQLPNLLEQLKENYQVLEINGLRSAKYQTLYFDTAKFKFFLGHHNGKPNRFKVRIRKYLDSDLCFFEIKHKKKGRTNKKRMKIADFQEAPEGETKEFLNRIIKSEPELVKRLWNNFERITLVNNERKERLTLDIGLNFTWEDGNFGYDDIIIAEVKQESNNRQSPCMELFKKEKIRQARVSKYCIGMGLLYKDLKQNNFKKKYLLIDKIRQNAQ